MAAGMGGVSALGATDVYDSFYHCSTPDRKLTGRRHRAAPFQRRGWLPPVMQAALVKRDDAAARRSYHPLEEGSVWCRLLTGLPGSTSSPPMVPE
jgi:hypothetical protein